MYIHVYVVFFCLCRGWEQLEVTCNPRGLDKNNVWNVEGNENDECMFDSLLLCTPPLSLPLFISSVFPLLTVPNASFDFYKPSYFSKFLESHVVMAEVGPRCIFISIKFLFAFLLWKEHG